MPRRDIGGHRNAADAAHDGMGKPQIVVAAQLAKSLPAPRGASSPRQIAVGVLDRDHRSHSASSHSVSAPMSATVRPGTL